jgi:pilus assembly protein CpaF
MSVDRDQYTLADLVGDAVAGEINRREVAHLEPMEMDDERRFARSTLRKELRRRNEAALGAGLEPLTTESEDEIIDETLNAVFGFGELERWLQDPSVQDVHINGFDRVFIKTRDGRRNQVSQIAASDAELRRLIADFARRMGRVEQRFDYANPIIDMQLPNGDRLNAMFSVSSRPSMSIRRHNFAISSLDELMDLGVMDGVIVRFLRAAVRGRRNLVISGGTGTG